VLISDNKKYIFPLFILMLFGLFTVIVKAEQELTDIEYVSIEPVIVTNYMKKSSKRPGFVQLKAQLVVRSKESADLVMKHMPLIRDYIVEFLSFTQEKVIKDVSSRNRIRSAMATGIQKLLTDNTGDPLIEDLVFTHFMWD